MDGDDLETLIAAVAQPAGNTLGPHRPRGDPDRLRPPGGPLRRRDIVSAGELAPLWHLPAGATAALIPVRARRLLPPPAAVARGARAGVAAHQAIVRPVHLPPDLLGRHHLIVAKTRRGKSTLLLHLARHLLDRAAAGGERLALAENWGMVARNPAARKRVTIARGERHDLTALTPAVARAAVEAFRGDNFEALVTGLRKGAVGAALASDRTRQRYDHGALPASAHRRQADADGSELAAEPAHAGLAVRQGGCAPGAAPSPA